MQFLFPDYSPFEVHMMLAIAVFLFVVWPVSSWIIGIGMRQKIRRDLGRRAIGTDLTSIDTWMKVDEVEQRNETSTPFTAAAEKAGDTVLRRAINRIFAGYDYKRDSERRMRDPRTKIQRKPDQAVQDFRVGGGHPFAITSRLVGMVACVVFATAYSAADGAGWIPHTKVVTVSTISSSLVIDGGTYCYSHQTSPAQLIGSLHCIGIPDEPHDLKVTFWGRNDTQTDRTWTCRPVHSLFHKENALTCTLQRQDYE